MRRKRARISRIDEVRILREGDDAIIESRESAFETTHLRISPEVTAMTDEEILLLFNQLIAAGIRHRDELGEYVAIEVPSGSSQVMHYPGSINQWAPRGMVLRCTIDHGGGDGGSLPVIAVDDQEFSWDEFGRMLCTFAGCGMQLIFVPDDELERSPTIEVRKPNERRPIRTLPEPALPQLTSSIDAQGEYQPAELPPVCHLKQSPFNAFSLRRSM